MSELPDIDELLQRAAASLDPEIPASNIDQLFGRIKRRVRPVTRGTRVVVSTYTLIAFLVCLVPMIALSFQWWLILASFIGSFGLTLVFWRFVRAIV